MGPERNNFLRRNRIIAGLSTATLVVESAKKGGALITADIASSYGKEVLSVPGRVSDDRSRGCNIMIKSQMAAMVESAEDIIKHLNWDGEGCSLSTPPKMVELTSQEKKLLVSMNEMPDINPGELSKLMGLPVQNILAMLLEMELKEWISVEPGNRYLTRISLHLKPIYVL